MASQKNAPVIEVVAQENDDILFASDMGKERRQRAASLVALNQIPAERAIKTLTPDAEPIAVDTEIQDLLNASQEEDDQPFEFIPPKLKLAPAGVEKFILDSGETFDEITGVIAISQRVRAWWPG